MAHASPGFGWRLLSAGLSALAALAVVSVARPAIAVAAYGDPEIRTTAPHNGDNVFDRVGDWFATVGKSADEKEAIINRRRTERALKRTGEKFQRSAEKVGDKIDEAGDKVKDSLDKSASRMHENHSLD